VFKPGDDGDLEIGQAWPNPRFIVGNGVQEDCILDRLTGLNWARSFSGQYGSWFIDIEIVNNMSLRGFNDWRLPNVTEMSSLFNFGVTRIYDWLRDQGFQFPCIGCATSTTYPSETGKFYYSNFDIVNIESFPKSLNYHFLPVRGGQKEISDPHYPGNVWKTGQTLTYYDRDDGDLKMGVSWPNPRFTDNGDGTITDLFTSLMWSKNANCLKTQYPDFDNDGSQGDGGISWNHAFDFINGMNAELFSQCNGGHHDWRLPNVNELRSLIDYSKFHLSLPSGHPFIMVGDNGRFSYWTSTTDIGDSVYAFVIDFDFGLIKKIEKQNVNFIWPVRSLPD
jgi:hypothetical protein